MKSRIQHIANNYDFIWDMVSKYPGEFIKKINGVDTSGKLIKLLNEELYLGVDVEGGTVVECPWLAEVSDKYRVSIINQNDVLEIEYDKTSCAITLCVDDRGVVGNISNHGKTSNVPLVKIEFSTEYAGSAEVRDIVDSITGYQTYPLLYTDGVYLGFLNDITAISTNGIVTKQGTVDKLYKFTHTIAKSLDFYKLESVNKMDKNYPSHLTYDADLKLLSAYTNGHWHGSIIL